MESSDGVAAPGGPKMTIGSTTCCACPVCTCGVNCACPKGEGAGCDPCAAFIKEAASFVVAETDPVDHPNQDKTSDKDKPQQEVGSTTCCACPVCTCGPTCACPKGEGAGCDPCASFMKAAASSIAPAASLGDQRPRGEAKAGEARRNETPSVSPAPLLSQVGRIMKLTQTKIRDKSGHRQRNHGGGGGDKNKRRWSTSRRGKGKSRGGGGGGGRGGRGGPSREEKLPDVFDAWLGVKLTAWKEGGETATRNEEGGGALSSPPEESGVTEEVDFDPSKDEIAFPACLSALQRRQVHGWAMQLALFHASSGEEQERHVIVSKTGIFQGKILTRGGRTWYKKGVTAPVVERFALKPDHEEIAAPIVAALHSFHQSVQLREPGFEEWLKAYAPPPDGSASEELQMEKAQEAFLKWPLLHEVEVEYVDTPEKLSVLAEALESCEEFAFDLEAHNARTYHGLSCLLQISIQSKDYLVDPLAPGMWDSMPLLRGAFGNPGVLKIGHSIRSLDVPSLYRDFGIVVVNAIDTEEAVHALGEKHSGLGKVLVNAGVRETYDVAGLKQAMQACDWRERPLSPDKLMYARCDAHYLIPLWRLLRARLLAADTFSNREDAKEAEELREIKRGLDADQQRKEEALRQRRIPPPALSMEGAGSGLLSMKGYAALRSQNTDSVSPAAANPGMIVSRGGGSPAKSPSRSGANSPTSLAQEPWTSDWDDPEDCHKRERSRSGSIYRPDLESIHERGDAAGLESALVAAFQEEDSDGGGDDDDDDEDAGVGAPTNGSAGSHHDGDLSRNLMEGDDEHEQEEAAEEGDGDYGGEEDEDEDLWDGWGQEGTSAGPEESAALATAGVAEDRTAVVDEDGRRPSVTGGGVATAADDDAVAAAPLPLSAPTVPLQSSPTVPLQSSPTASAHINGGSWSEGGRRTVSVSPPPEPAAPPATRLDSNRRSAAVSNEPSTVALTDGVRLVWKTVSRTQVAAAVLWQPALEAKREDSHNERHFRTAVQRLKPPRWTEVNVRVYEEIYLWRDKTARRMDDGAAYVCPGDILIDVALAMPKTLDALRRVSAPLSPVLGHADTPEAAELVRVVRVALGLPAEEREERERESDGRIGDRAAPRNLEGGDGDCAGVDVVSPKPAVALAVAAAAALLGVMLSLSRPRKV